MSQGSKRFLASSGVYNFTVEDEHCYRVSTLGALVHNNGCALPAPGTALVPRSTVELGKWGEARLAQVLGNQGVKPASAFKTSLGNRFFDRLANGVAHAAKAGIDVGLTPVDPNASSQRCRTDRIAQDHGERTGISSKVRNRIC